MAPATTRLPAGAVHPAPQSLTSAQAIRALTDIAARPGMPAVRWAEQGAGR